MFSYSPTDDLLEWKWAYIAVDETFSACLSLVFEGSAHDAVLVHILQTTSGNAYVILFFFMISTLYLILLI
jgi:hypothetical protein